MVLKFKYYYKNVIIGNMLNIEVNSSRTRSQNKIGFEKLILTQNPLNLTTLSLRNGATS